MTVIGLDVSGHAAVSAFKQPRDFKKEHGWTVGGCVSAHVQSKVKLWSCSKEANDPNPFCFILLVPVYYAQ